MRAAESVVIQGVRAPDDGLPIDLSGPDGPDAIHLSRMRT